MMHKAWSSIEEVPYCFSRSSVKFQGHIALKIVEFDSNWAFLDCNSSLNTPMAMKFCTKLETAKKRCPIAFQFHPSDLPCFIMLENCTIYVHLHLPSLFCFIYIVITFLKYPGSKVHGANMEPTWVLSAPDGPHVGPMNLAIRVLMYYL